MVEPVPDCDIATHKLCDEACEGLARHISLLNAEVVWFEDANGVERASGWIEERINEIDGGSRSAWRTG